MITEWFALMGMGIAEFFASIFPDWDVPAFMSGNVAQMEQLLQTFTGMGVWVDWVVMGLCLAAVAVAYGIGIVVRLARAAAAHIPQFGGAGA